MISRKITTFWGGGFVAASLILFLRIFVEITVVFGHAAYLICLTSLEAAFLMKNVYGRRFYDTDLAYYYHVKRSLRFATGAGGKVDVTRPFDAERVC